MSVAGKTAVAAKVNLLLLLPTTKGLSNCYLGWQQWWPTQLLSLRRLRQNRKSEEEVQRRWLVRQRLLLNWICCCCC